MGNRQMPSYVFLALAKAVGFTNIGKLFQREAFAVDF